MTRVHLDASCLIYLVEGAPALRVRVAQRIGLVLADLAGIVGASPLARIECRVKPLRTNDASILADYEAIFTAVRFALVDVTEAVLERATDVRVRYGFKTPDAIHVATAIESGADAFLTGDSKLARCREIPIEVISPSTI